MKIRLKIREAPSLHKKGISHIIEVFHTEIQIDGVKRAREYVEVLSREIENKFGLKIDGIEFTGNEDIGSRYILYRFRLYTKDGYIGCRIVTFFNRHLLTILTVGEGLL